MKARMNDRQQTDNFALRSVAFHTIPFREDLVSQSVCQNMSPFDFHISVLKVKGKEA
jgi:hypothetical protein